MTQPVARWRKEHLRFSQVLDLLERQLDRFHYGERPDYALMLEAMRYMTHYVDASHHPREDLAFSRLAEHEPRARRVVADLLEEHTEIIADGDLLVALLEGVLDDAFIPREKVEQPGRAYIHGFRAHMRREERIFPWVSMTLGAPDWSEIDKAVPEIDDPLLAGGGTVAYELLRERLARPRDTPLGVVA